MAALLRVLFLALPVLFTPGVHAHRHVTSAPQHACHIAGSQLVRCGGDAALGRTAFAPLASHGVSAGVNFTCALRVNGSMTCWGALPGMTRGDFDAFYWTAPDAFLDISAGDAHVCGLRYDGTLRCYGDNSAGQAAPPGGDSVRYTTVSCGAQYTCGVTRGDYTVRCFGAAAAPVVPSQLSRPAPSLTDAVVHVSSGARHACALRANGSVTCFGSDSVPSPPASVAMDWIAAGDGFSCGITRDVGSVVCVGDAPTGLPVTSGWQELSCSTGYCCGVTSDDISTVTCFGNRFPQWPTSAVPCITCSTSIAAISAGRMHAVLQSSGEAFFWVPLDCTGTGSSQVPFPPLLPGSKYVQVASARNVGCAAQDDGGVACVGLAPSSVRSVPTSIRASAVAVGSSVYGDFACAILVNGTTSCWGNLVTAASCVTVPADESYIAISAGDTHVCGLRSNGSVRCDGALFTFPPSCGSGFTPRVPAIVALASGNRFSCGLSRNGSVYCWGSDSYGIVSGAPPRRLQARAISAAADDACILTMQGSLHCWGSTDRVLIDPPSPTCPFVSIAMSDMRVVALSCTAQVSMYDLESASYTQMRTCLTGVDARLLDTQQGTALSCASLTVGAARCWSDTAGVFLNAEGSLVAGSQHACAIDARDRAVCVWVRDGREQSIQSLVLPVANVYSVAALYSAVCWTDASSVAGCVSLDGTRLPTIPFSITDTVVTGFLHACALSSVDSFVRCYGDDTHGQLRLGARAGTRFTFLSAGAYHTCGITEADSSIACWGAGFQDAPVAALLRTHAWTALISRCAVSCAMAADPATQPQVLCWHAAGVALWLAEKEVDAVELVFASTRTCTRLRVFMTPPQQFFYTLTLGSRSRVNTAVAARSGVLTCTEASLTWTMTAIGEEAGVARFTNETVFVNGLCAASFVGKHSRIHHVDLGFASVPAVASDAFRIPTADSLTSLHLAGAVDAGGVRRLQIQANALTLLQNLTQLTLCTAASAACRPQVQPNTIQIHDVDVYAAAYGQLSLDAFSALRLIANVSIQQHHITALLPSNLVWPSVRSLRIEGAAIAANRMQLASSALTELPGLVHLSLRSSNVHTGTAGIFDLSALPRNATIVDLRTNMVTTFLPPSISLPALQMLLICSGNPGAADVLTHSVRMWRNLPAATSFSLPANGSAKSHKLNLAGCGISTLNESVVAAAWPGAALDFDLSHNNISSLSDVRGALSQWARGRTDVAVDLSHNRLQSVFPGDTDDLRPLSALSFAANNISFIHVDAFPPLLFPRLQSLILEDNPAQASVCPPGFTNVAVTLPAGAVSTACSPCPPGHFCPGDGRIYACAPGFYSDAALQSLASVCVPCPMGTFNGQAGVTHLECNTCPVGRASNHTGATSVDTCSSCAAGRYAVAPGMGECIACPPGSYGSGTGASSLLECTLCPLGRWSGVAAARGVDTCSKCAAGTTTLSRGASSPSECIPVLCEPGSVPSAVQQTRGGDAVASCTQCAAGRFAGPLATTCADCAPGSYARSAGAPTCVLCPVYSYGSGAAATSDAACQECPRTSVCRLDRTGCDLICPAGQRLRAASDMDRAVEQVLAAARASCGAISPQVAAQACIPCSRLPTSICIPSAGSDVLSLASFALSPTPMIVQPVNQGSGSVNDSIRFSVMPGSRSCASAVRMQLQDAPRAQYVSTQIAVLAALSGFAFAAVLMTLIPALHTSLLPFLRKLDVFSTSHAVPLYKPLRNLATPWGGRFSISFLIVALAGALAIMLQPVMQPLIVSDTIVDVPPFVGSTFAQGVESIHVGDAALHVVMAGTSDTSTPCAVSLSVPSAIGPGSSWVSGAGTWTTLASPSVADVFGRDALASMAASPIAELPVCFVTLACPSCRMSAPQAVTFSVDSTFQSLLLAVRTRDAFTGCAPKVTALLTARTPAALLSQATLDVRVLPVYIVNAVTYAPPLAASTGYDTAVNSVSVTTRAMTSMFNSGLDAVTVTLTLTPTTYMSVITVDDAADALALAMTALGFVSGLAGATKLCMRLSEKFSARCMQACTRKERKGGQTR